ncbi:hypothetical protein [Agrobacterium tumefaciens]|uniref:hypothetical protein n=1 Tax=Agrobacterium tumefaciens TaxID=358 RepID=UPI0015746125|nr:hypothetical protein [Agrobacterium tumefaciens]
MAKLLATIAKAIASAMKRAGSLLRMGIRKTGNFCRGALASLGIGHGGMQPPEMEEIETVPDMTAFDEAIDQLSANMDDENEAEFKAQHRALTDGMEPKDICDYTRADSSEKRDEIAKLMRKDTVTWVKEKLTDEQRSRIAKTSEDAVKYHISGVRLIPGVPAFPKNDMKNVAEFKPQDPAAVMHSMNINVEKAMRVAEAAARDPLPKPMPGVGIPARKAVNNKKADEPELDYDAAPGLALRR